MKGQPRREARRRGERERGPRALVAVLLATLASLLWFELPVDALTTMVGAAQRPPARVGLDWLSVSNQQIVDSSGRVVTLHGFNTSALLEPTVRRAPLDGDDAALMERDGFNVVRLAVSWGRLEPERGRWDGDYLDSIAATVELLNAHHLYVVIDMHFLDWSSRFGGSGAPSWAAIAGVPDLHITQLGDWQRHLSPAVNAATSYFWLSPDWQGDFLATWRVLGARFRGDSGVAGYDLYNEPHALPLPPVRFERDLMWPLYARAIDAIGGVDANHLFVVEGELLGDYGTEIVPLRAPNLVYSPHEYTGSLVPPIFDGSSQALDSHVRQVAGEASRVPGAIWVGEWGISSSQDHSGTWIDDALNAFDSAGAGWAWWQWREDSPWGVRDSAGHLNWTVLAHLARPYAAASPPGVHTAAIGTGNRRATITVTAAYDGGPIAIAWPEVSAGAPMVSGTCPFTTSWDGGTARLVLAAPAHVRCTVELSAPPG